MLGPIPVIKVKFTPDGFARRLTGEMWMYPDGSQIVELSTKCEPGEGFQVAAELRGLLSAAGSRSRRSSRPRPEPRSSTSPAISLPPVPRLGAGTRRVASIVLIAAGCLFLLVGELAIYTDRNIADADRFADRAVSALDDDATREEVGAIVARELEQANPDLIAYRALIEGLVSSLAGTQPFQSALRTGIAEAHRAAVDNGQDSAAVTIANFGVLATEGLRAIAPKAAKQIPDQFSAELISFSEGGFGTDLIQFDVGILPIVAPILALLFFGLGVAAANDRRAGMTGAALGVAGIGALMVLAYVVGEALVVHAATDAGAGEAVSSLWSALLGDLRDWNLTLCFAGAIVAGASASLLRPADAPSALRRLQAALERQPETSLGRALRGLTLLGVGIFALAAPSLAVRVLGVVLGLGLSFVGASELLELIAGPAETRERAQERSTQVLRRVLVATVAIGALVIVVLIARNDHTESDASPSTGCSGSEELCDRTLDEVAVAATHNSMAAADYPGFLFPMQVATIPKQLEDGIHGLLIDAYYGYPGSRVYTDFDRGPNKLREQIESELGPDFAAAADRVRADIASPDGESDLFLCHGFCEMGAIGMVDTLTKVRDFVVNNPNEVLMIVIEDYVKPADVVDAFQEAGLADYAYDGPLDPLPTLGEVVDSGKPVIVLAENHAGIAPWYRLAYDYFQETPFDFKTPAEMSCDRNRGAKRNPLFLINNWINTDPQAKPSNAAKVNAHDFLLQRASECATERDLFPNVLAVDFYNEGDVLGVADELNGVDDE